MLKIHFRAFFLESNSYGGARVSRTRWKPHKSKDHNFLHRNYIPIFFPTPKKNIFFSKPKIKNKISRNIRDFRDFWSKSMKNKGKPLISFVFHWFWSKIMKNRDFLTKKWVPITHQNTFKSKKTPEMNELEADKYATQIWAHNFKKQKS